MTRPIALFLTLLAPAFASAADPIAGRWVGQWTSDANGHRGPLRAHLMATKEGYSATFAGRFAGVVPFVYRTPLQIVAINGESVQLAAERRLPIFGTFRTDAIVTPTHFEATFRSGRDSGRFILTR
ncbi:MAG: hypothetical protein MUF18_06665 [Fimbriiglobus sp.]|jgi:hypothetical protein|nr:hypothetical protein [Fimbriiglobus sp.]